MEKRRAKSNTKRQRKNDGKNGESKQRKMPRLASPPPVKSAEVTKIIDLNDDCLVKIFGHLDVQDLFNVATSNAFLRPAACEVYKRKFGKMKVSIEEVAKFRPNTRAAARNDCSNKSLAPEFDDKNGVITVRGLKISLRYLRYFGSCITDLMVDYGKTASNSKRYAYVHQYINDYCAESLLHFGFYFMPTNAAIEQFQKDFANVRKVTIVGNCMVLQNPSFVKWFPELRDLKLIDVQYYVSIREPLHHLEHLHIIYHYCNGFLTDEIAADLLNGVNQLKSLTIDHYMDNTYPVLQLCSFDTWLDLIKGQSSIAAFGVADIGQMTTANVQRLVKNHSALVELQLPNYWLKIVHAIALIRQLNSLKEFEFQMLDPEHLQLVSQLDGEWESSYNYIASNAHYVHIFLRRKI